MKPITVNDSVMGSGKTSLAIQIMNENPDRQWIFSSPFLDELERIKDACPELHFKTPVQIDGRKLHGFNHLLANGENIAVSHSCFIRADETTFNLLNENSYSLILDEAIDVLVPFNDITDSTLKRSDVQMLINEGFITVDEYGKVQWSKRSYRDTVFSAVEEMAENGNLFCLNGNMFCWRFPPRMWSLFNDVQLLTYMFDGNFMKSYFDYYDIAYHKVSTVKKDDVFQLSSYSIDAEKEKRAEFKKLITIFGDKLKIETSNKDNFLCVSWYRTNKRNDPARLKKLKSAMQSFIKNKVKAKAKDIMWTAFSDYETDLAGQGYTRFRKEPAEIEKLVADAEKSGETIEPYTKCFVPCNAKASNKFSDRSVLMYCCNLYPNTVLEHFFDLKNAVYAEKEGYTPIKFNKNAYALSNFLQWTWRSAIRNNKPISIFIPSKRIRKLFENWLNGDDRLLAA